MSVRDDAEAILALEVRAMTPADGPSVLAIYQAGIDTGNATFEVAAPDWEDWDRAHLPEHRFVATEPGGGRVLGWVALSGVSDRCVYAGVAEVSVYVAPRARGRGVGLTLLTSVIEATERAGIWTVQAGIFPENVASVALHRRAGFRVVGVRRRLGRLRGAWRDVLLMERRSPLVA